MLFNSWSFIPFLLTVLGLYYALPHRAQNRLLLVASYVFYGAWDVRFLGLLIFSTTVDYVVGRLLGATVDERKRKAILLLSIATNLGLLGFFKYFNFFAESFAALTDQLGWNVHPTTLRVILPVGISFYTFQSLSYTIDVYRRRQEPERSLLDLATFVAFFPQLVAGPIERVQKLLPQIKAPRRTTRAQVQEGLWLILWGLFKKVAVADNLAIFVDRAFASEVPDGGPRALLAVYAFALQIYGDFSGYTDIARGVAKLMGFEMMRNFDRPYLAANPADFWRRWHISLSSWLRDYLYIALGGNRRGPARTYVNLLLTMLLGGLWHGAAWTFVLWGLFHGLLVAIHRAWQSKPIPRALAVVGTFHLVCLGWLLFRATSVAQAFAFLRAIFTDLRWTEGAAQLLLPLLGLGGLMFAVESWVRSEDNPAQAPRWQTWGPLTATALALLVLLLAPPAARSFIYFQF